MKLIWKLLRKHISVAELSLFFIANLVGIVIILAGIQIYSDIRPLLSGEKSLIGNDYMVISHPVERVGGKPKLFSNEEIEALRSEEFVLDIGGFRSSHYEVNGSISFNGQRLSTMLFFEAVPDNFIDTKSEAWKFEPEDRVIPIIIPRNYLNLYNFGFSQTQSLPQITEELIKRVELGIELSGNGLEEEFKGYIVGFSERLNTILVPMEMMEWANARFAKGEQEEVSRLIIEVANPGAPEVTKYLAEHGYVAEDRAAESSKAMLLLNVSVVVIICIGIIFSILSLAILTLSIYLLLQKNIDKLRNLMLIGYTPRYVARPYTLLTVALNGSILVVAVVIVALLQRLYMGYLSEITAIELPCSPLASALSGVAITLLLALFNIVVIRHKINDIKE